MVVLQRNISREDIIKHRGFMSWFKIDKENNEILFLINEKHTNKVGEIVNVINYRENFGRLCIDSIKFGQEFFEKYKEYNPRIFIRQDAGYLYNEYDIEKWEADDEGLLIKFK
jgi:hypothetical protein